MKNIAVHPSQEIESLATITVTIRGRIRNLGVETPRPSRKLEQGAIDGDEPCIRAELAPRETHEASNNPAPAPRAGLRCDLKYGAGTMSTASVGCAV